MTRRRRLRPLPQEKKTHCPPFRIASAVPRKRRPTRTRSYPMTRRGRLRPLPQEKKTHCPPFRIASAVPRSRRPTRDQRNRPHRRHNRRQHHNSYNPADHEYISPLLQTMRHIMPHIPLQCNRPRLRVVFCYGRLDFLRLNVPSGERRGAGRSLNSRGGPRLSTLTEDNLSGIRRRMHDGRFPPTRE